MAVKIYNYTNQDMVNWYATENIEYESNIINTTFTQNIRPH